MNNVELKQLRLVFAFLTYIRMYFTNSEIKKIAQLKKFDVFYIFDTSKKWKLLKISSHSSFFMIHHTIRRFMVVIFMFIPYIGTQKKIKYWVPSKVGYLLIFITQSTQKNRVPTHFYYSINSKKSGTYSFLLPNLLQKNRVFTHFCYSGLLN